MAVGLALTLQACGTENRNTVKFVVMVETPQGMKTGSSVVEFIESSPPSWFPAQGGSTSTRGEGVFVDLGGGQNLIMAVDYVYGIKPTLNGVDQAQLSMFHRREGEISLAKGEATPIFVSFKSLTEPNSGFAVDPSNLSSSFGDGYKIVSVRVEPTGESPSKVYQIKYPDLFQAHPGLRDDQLRED